MAAPGREALLSLLSERLDALGLGVLVLDHGRVVDADPAAERLTGRAVDELRAVADVSALLAPEERFKRTVYRERRRRGEIDDDVFRTIVVRPDGSRRPIEAAVFSLGGPFSALVLRDLTDEATLDQVIDWYASLVERMPVGVVIMDANEVTDPREIRLWSANAAASAVAGRDLAALVGRPLAEVFPWAKRFDEARRALALSGTGRVEHFPELVVGDADQPTGVYRRTVVGLPEGGIALVLADITRERLDDLRQRHLAERLVSLGDTERRAIAMGIHDDPIQQIAAASLMVSQLRRRSNGDDRSPWLEEIEGALRRATTSLRDLVFDLAPPELVESGLASAVASSVDHLFADSPTSVDVDIDLTAEPPQAVQSTAFRIIAEALSNARRHAGASWVGVRSRVEGRTITIEVADNGTGAAALEERPGHLGLRSMHDRAAAIGGSVEVRSGPTGTTVSAVLPIDGVPAAVDRPAATEPLRIPSRPDSDVVSLRLELESLRDSHARRGADVLEARERLAVIGRTRDALDAMPLDVDGRADRAAELVARAVRDACAIRIATPDGSTLRTVACWHADTAQRAYLETWVLADRNATTSHPSLIYTTQQPLLLDQSRFDWWLPSDGPPPPPAPFEPHHAIGVPLRRGGRPFGVMTVVRDRSPDPLTNADIPWVWALADVVAAALAM